jgi:phosphoglycolate phosphatase
MPVLMRRTLSPEASEQDAARALDYFIRYSMRVHVRCSTSCRRRGDAWPFFTNKPVRISQRIVEGLGLHGHFFDVSGGNSFEQKKPHPIGIETLLETTKLPHAEALMVGDSGVDVETARLRVTFGLSPQTVRAASPDYLIDEMPALTPIVLK